MSRILIPLVCLCGLTEVKAQQGQLDNTSFSRIEIPLRPHTYLKDSVFMSNRFGNSIMFHTPKLVPLIDYNTTIFCKFEHEIKMNGRLPLKMRLGDVRYVDKLEGKYR